MQTITKTLDVHNGVSASFLTVSLLSVKAQLWRININLACQSIKIVLTYTINLQFLK